MRYRMWARQTVKYCDCTKSVITRERRVGRPFSNPQPPPTFMADAAQAQGWKADPPLESHQRQLFWVTLLRFAGGGGGVGERYWQWGRVIFLLSQPLGSTFGSSVLWDLGKLLALSVYLHKLKVFPVWYRHKNKLDSSWSRRVHRKIGQDLDLWTEYHNTVWHTVWHMTEKDIYWSNTQHERQMAEGVSDIRKPVWLPALPLLSCRNSDLAGLCSPQL